MQYSQGLAVGLSIGIPSALILAGCFLMWFRNQRKQLREDKMVNDIDLGLRDDALFQAFQEELHRPYKGYKEDSQVGEGEPEGAAERTFQASLLNGSSDTAHFAEKRTPSSLHQKNPSSYDFYETVIPIIPSTPGRAVRNSTANTHDENSLPNPEIQDTTPINNASRDSVPLYNPKDSSRDGISNSLDNLARQLTGPALFEKLPSRAATVSLKQKHNTVYTNNSSGDLITSTLPETDCINDRYVFSAAEVKDGNEGHSRSSSKLLNTQNNRKSQDVLHTVESQGSANHDFIDVDETDALVASAVENASPPASILT